VNKLNFILKEPTPKKRKTDEKETKKDGEKNDRRVRSV
jgi:hypothetical protein